MKYAAVLLLLFTALSLKGCGSGDGASLESTLPNPSVPPGGGGAPPGSPVPGALGDLVDLGDLVEPLGDKWYETRPLAINNSGLIVGSTNRGWPTTAAFLWRPDAGMTFLGIHGRLPGGLGCPPGVDRCPYDDYYGLKQTISDNRFIHSVAVDLNDSGVVICNSSTQNPAEKRAFVWKSNGEWVDLSPRPYLSENGKWTVGSFSEAVDINNHGEIVLTAETRRGRNAFFWDGVSFSHETLDIEQEEGEEGEEGEEREKGTREIVVPHLISLGGIVGADSTAVAINENRQAISNSGGTAVFTDLRWLSFDLIIVESLNHLPGANFTVAAAINDRLPTGLVVGSSGTGGPFSKEIQADPKSFLEEAKPRGFFWDGGAMYPVQDLGGGSSMATDVNNLDQVVGAATVPDGSFHAFLWTLGDDRKGHIRDLGTLGGKNSHAVSINDAGQVIGWSETGEMYSEQGVTVPIRHAFLWQNGTMYDLGTHDYFYNYPFTPPFPFSEAKAINNNGQVAGNSLTINTHSRGFTLTPVFP
jgi:probable HAF family extracellular repeat protein